MPDVLRVLVMDIEPAWRGGQSQALLLLKGLRARGCAAELLSTRNSALASRAASENIPVHAAAEPARRWDAARLLRRMLQENRFDIVHANDAHALTAAWMARAHRHVPLVAARRVVFPLPRGRVALARYRAAGAILAISEAVRAELLAAGLDPQRIQVIADGVEIPAEISAAERRRARERWGFSPQERVLAFLASFTTEKGHALLIEAFTALKRQLSGCRLLLAGEGPLRPKIEVQAHAAGLSSSVVFAGFVQDVAAVYAACDLFVFPSLSEGAGTSLLSAMACGLPVVALARGGIIEIVEDGKNGLLVKEAAAGLIAQASARLLSDVELSRKLSLAARETVAARFSAGRMVDRTLAVFENLAAAPTLPR